MIAAWVSSNLKKANCLKSGITMAIWGMIMDTKRILNIRSRILDLYFSNPKAANEFTARPKITVENAIITEFKKKEKTA
jgi:hypothetical protein